MRIAILTNSSSGLFRFRGDLIRGLLDGGVEVSVLTPDSGDISKLKGMGCQITAVEVDRRGTNPFHDMPLFQRYIKYLREERPDLVLTYTVKPNVYGGLACRALKIPYAANVAGLGTAFEGGGLLLRLVTGMYRVGVRGAGAVFFENSENMRLFLGEGLCSEAQACLLSGAGVNLERFAVAPYPDAEAPSGPVRLLFVGRVMREKGVGELLEAVRALRARGVDATLDVVGPMEEEWGGRLAACEREGWLSYRGRQDDVRPFYVACHCLVLPSWHEGMANVNLEAAAMGRPVVTSDIPGCREAVVDGVSGLLCAPRDPGSLEGALASFCSMGAVARREMGLAGRAHMEANFDKRAVVAATLARLEGLVYPAATADASEGARGA